MRSAIPKLVPFVAAPLAADPLPQSQTHREISAAPPARLPEACRRPFAAPAALRSATRAALPGRNAAIKSADGGLGQKAARSTPFGTPRFYPRETPNTFASRSGGIPARRHDLVRQGKPAPAARHPPHPANRRHGNKSVCGIPADIWSGPATHPTVSSSAMQTASTRYCSPKYRTAAASLNAVAVSCRR